MPLYEYQCDDCDHEFEKLVSFSSSYQNPECPICQGKNTRRKISKIASFSTGGSSGTGSTGSGCSSRGRFS